VFPSVSPIPCNGSKRANSPRGPFPFFFFLFYSGNVFPPSISTSALSRPPTGRIAAEWSIAFFFSHVRHGFNVPSEGFTENPIQASGKFFSSPPPSGTPSLFGKPLSFSLMPLRKVSRLLFFCHMFPFPSGALTNNCCTSRRFPFFTKSSRFSYAALVYGLDQAFSIFLFFFFSVGLVPSPLTEILGVPAISILRLAPSPLRMTSFPARPFGDDCLVFFWTLRHFFHFRQARHWTLMSSSPLLLEDDLFFPLWFFFFSLVTDGLMPPLFFFLF